MQKDMSIKIEKNVLVRLEPCLPAWKATMLTITPLYSYKMK